MCEHLGCEKFQCLVEMTHIFTYQCLLNETNTESTSD